MSQSVVKVLLSIFLLTPILSGGTVFDQIGPDSAYLTESRFLTQRYEASMGFLDMAAIDDFQLTQTVRLTSAASVVSGGSTGGHLFSNFGNVQSWGLEIYSSVAAAGANLTGDVLSVSVLPSGATITQPFGTWAGGSIQALITVDLTGASATLLPGTYWMALIPRMDSSYGSLAVVSSSYAGTSNGWQVAPPWSPGYTGWQNPQGVNMAYRLDGDTVGDSVPEPSTWLLLLAGLPLVPLGRVLRRRAARQ